MILSAASGDTSLRLPPPPGGGRPLAAPILQMIWEHQRISRADIARQSGLSRSTVTEAVRQLLTTGLVREIGEGEARGGRKPILLEFQDQACVILGVDVGATHVAVVLMDMRGRILHTYSVGHDVREDPVGTMQLIEQLARTCLDERRDPAPPLLGIGVGLPCPVDPEHPDRVPEIVLPRWEGRSRLEDIAAAFDRPLLADNDANLGALAEYWWGAGRGQKDFAYIKIATGIGLGQILAGRIYRGASGVAGEIGHLAINPRGRQCVCGLRGCLTMYAGSAALVSRTEELLPKYPESTLSRHPVSPAALEQAALAGDPLALRVVGEAAQYLGITVAGLLNLNNPGMVILGGGITRLGDILLDPLRDTVRQRTLVNTMSATCIRTGELGYRTVALGAGTLVLDAAFRNPQLFPQWTNEDAS